MSKNYDLYCSRHGHIHIEVEKPPAISKYVYCPWCAQRLMRPDKDMKEMFQPNYVSEGVPA